MPTCTCYSTGLCIRDNASHETTKGIIEELYSHY